MKLRVKVHKTQREERWIAERMRRLLHPHIEVEHAYTQIIRTPYGFTGKEGVLQVGEEVVKAESTSDGTVLTVRRGF